MKVEVRVRSRLCEALVICCAAHVVATAPRGRGHQPREPVVRSVAATDGTLGDWASRVDAMLRNGTLDSAKVQPDTMLFQIDKCS